MVDTVEERKAKAGFALWYGVVAGILFWAIHVSMMAAIQPYVCQTGRVFLFHLLSVATVIPTLVAFVPCVRALQKDTGLGGIRFMGQMGVLLNAIFLWAILAEWVPVFVLHECAM